MKLPAVSSGGGSGGGMARNLLLLLLVVAGFAVGVLFGELILDKASGLQQPQAAPLVQHAQVAKVELPSSVAADLAEIKASLAVMKQGSATPAAPAAVPAPVPAPVPAAATPLGPLGINADVAARNVTFGGASLTVLALKNDEYVGGWILRSGQPFEPNTLSWFMDKIKPGSTVVDAGCNFGSYSIFFASRVGPGGSVHCFEPQRKMAQMAGANAAVNGLSGVMEVHNNALSFAPGSVNMAATLPDGSAGGQSIRDVEARHGAINYGGLKLGKGGESAVAITLDSLGLKNVSFIKIDIQGAEQLMIYGAQETIRTNLPVVAYEHVEGWTVTPDMIESMKIPPEVLSFSVDAFFKGLGYVAEKRGGEMMQHPPGSPGAVAAAPAAAGGRRLLGM